MKRHDLVARGFVKARFSGPFSPCRACERYRWFDAWQPKGIDPLVVHACAECGTVPADERTKVARYPIVAQEAA
jgi:hypothetical protein